MCKATPINVANAFEKLTFLSNRTPVTSDKESKNSFSMLSKFRDGGIFVSTFAGNSEWERHASDDELVFAVEGQSELILFIDGEEVRNTLKGGELLVVPQNIWHRFESSGVKILTLTPQPTDHHVGQLPPEL